MLEIAIALISFLMGFLIAVRLYGRDVPAVSECDHLWGMWSGDFILQDRYCSKCGIAQQRRIQID